MIKRFKSGTATRHNVQFITLIKKNLNGVSLIHYLNISYSVCYVSSSCYCTYQPNVRWVSKSFFVKWWTIIINISRRPRTTIHTQPSIDVDNNNDYEKFYLLKKYVKIKMLTLIILNGPLHHHHSYSCMLDNLREELSWTLNWVEENYFFGIKIIKTHTMERARIL